MAISTSPKSPDIINQEAMLRTVTKLSDPQMLLSHPRASRQVSQQSSTNFTLSSGRDLWLHLWLQVYRIQQKSKSRARMSARAKTDTASSQLADTLLSLMASLYFTTSTKTKIQSFLMVSAKTVPLNSRTLSNSSISLSLPQDTPKSHLSRLSKKTA